jgi:hypothetical protein
MNPGGNNGKRPSSNGGGANRPGSNRRH